MDVFEAISRRHSYRGPYTSDPVPREDLERIVEAGVRAPRGCNEQTTSFVVLDDPEILQAVYRVLGSRNPPPALIVCVADPKPVFRGMSFEIEDCAAAVENMLLAVTALGYASVWIDGVLRVEDRAEKLAALLGVPSPKCIRVILPVGRPVEEGSQREKKPVSERLSYNRFG